MKHLYIKLINLQENSLYISKLFRPFKQDKLGSLTIYKTIKNEYTPPPPKPIYVGL